MMREKLVSDFKKADFKAVFVKPEAKAEPEVRKSKVTGKPLKPIKEFNKGVDHDLSGLMRQYAEAMDLGHTSLANTIMDQILHFKCLSQPTYGPR